MTITKQQAADRIDSLADDDDIIYAIIEAGEDDAYWYYIVVLNRVYEGRDYLNERYVQLAKPEAKEDGRDDTFKTNGINRRVGGVMPFAASLSSAYEAVESMEQRYVEGQNPDDAESVFITSDGDAYEYHTDISLVE